jgi:CRP-like cAMP-binding protein
LLLIYFDELKVKLKNEFLFRKCQIIDEQLNSSKMNENDKLKILERVLTLKKTTLFSATAEHILVDIAMLAKEHRYENGASIFRKGDKGTSMYIIHSGSVRIHDNSKELAVLKENDFFGELAMLETESRSADATTTSDSMLLSIDQDAIYEIMEDRTEVARGIITVLCQRIRNLNEKFVAEMSAKIN